MGAKVTADHRSRWVLQTLSVKALGEALELADALGGVSKGVLAGLRSSS